MTIQKRRLRNMVVSLIGRPNVGKSSVFNALMGKQHKSITFDEPGVTRDRHYGIANLNVLGDDESEDIILVDTGGFYPERIEENDDNRDKFFNIMTGHAKTAIQESDLVLMVVDVREGALPYDEDIAKFIRSQGKEFWMVINKYDTDKQAGSEVDFYQIPVDDFFLVSAAHNRGLTELKEKIQQKAKAFKFTESKTSSLSEGITPREDVVARFALIGAPNAGKSTLLNNLVGAERALVSDIPGTTVDPIEGYFDLYFGKEALLLEEKLENKSDQMLFQQYEDFRFNNPDVYDRIMDSYQLEEESSDMSDDYLFEDDEMMYDEESESLMYSDDDEEELQSMQDQIFGEEADSDNEEDDEELELQDDEEREEAEAEVIAEESMTEEKPTGSFWRSIHLVDTAGIRKKSSIKDFVESQSVYRSLRCISESDIVIFMIDATKGIGHQDRRLMDIALEKGKSLIVCMNKVDLLKDKLKDDKARKEWIEDLRYDVPWLGFCDIIPISAKNNTGVKRLKKIMAKTIFIRRKMVATGELNRLVYSLIERNPVVVNRSGGKRLKVKYVSQVKSGPPTFLFFTNRSKGIPENYKRYLRNGLRRTFDLDNTPVHLVFRTGTDLEKRMKKIKRA